MLPDSLGSQLDERGWQAGAVVPHDRVPFFLPHLARYGQEAPTVELHDWLVVISQTCDVLQHDLEKEPLVEILHCRPVDEMRSDFQGRRSTRRLDFRANRKTHVDVCLTAHATVDRYVVPRELLLELLPDEGRQLSEKTVISLQQWYALRYSRPAWPDAFVDRINAAKNTRKKLSAALKQVPTDDVEVRVAVQQYDQELPDDQCYNVSVYFVVERDQWNESEEIRAATYRAHAQFVAALCACQGIMVDCELSGVKSGDEFSWQLTRTTDEWNFANLSEHD
jgi:hypothetical protein